MKVDQHTVLTMLERESPSEDVQVAHAFLRDETTRPASGYPNCVDANQLCDVWAPRLWNLRRKGVPAYGLAALVTNLERLPREEPVVQIGFEGPRGTGMFFIRQQDFTLVGFVVVSPPIASQPAPPDLPHQG